MESIDFNKLKIPELKEWLLQYNIDDEDIMGTGKNGRLLKIDRINALQQAMATQVNVHVAAQVNNESILPYEMVSEISQYLPIKTARLINKQNLKMNESRYQQCKKPYIYKSAKGKTPGLKPGDYVEFNDRRGLSLNNMTTAVVDNIYNAKMARVRLLCGPYKNNIYNIHRRELTVIEFEK